MSRTRTAVLLLAACLMMSATAQAKEWEKWTEDEKADAQLHIESMKKTIQAWPDAIERQIGMRCLHREFNYWPQPYQQKWESIAYCSRTQIEAYRQVKNGFPALKGK